jgi:hypothetical protein
MLVLLLLVLARAGRGVIRWRALLLLLLLAQLRWSCWRSRRVMAWW